MNKGLVLGGTQKEDPWKEVAGKIFTLSRDWISSLGKNDKKERKLNLKRWDVEALKEERLEVSSLGTPQNAKSTRDFWGKSTKRRKLWETRKGLAIKVASTTLTLVPRGAKEGNQWYPKTQGWHYKRGSIQQWRGIWQQWIRTELLRKLCQKTQRK